MKMTCLNATVFLSNYTVPHTWSRDLRADQICYTKLKYVTCIFFSCVLWRTGRVRSPARTQNIYHRLTAPCLSGWVKYAQEDRTSRP